MGDVIKLRQRFCKDCDIPINIFDEPYFSDRLGLFDFLYDSVSKWNLFKSEFKKYDSAIDYFTDYSRIKDEAIEAVRSAEGFQLFSAYGVNDFSIKNKGLPSGRIYNPENNGRIFLSIDMKKANFSALHEYRSNIFGGAHTWEEFVSRFTEQLVTPSTAETAFSTRAEQAAQLIPVTLYCFIGSSPSFWNVNSFRLNHFVKPVILSFALWR